MATSPALSSSDASSASMALDTDRSGILYFLNRIKNFAFFVGLHGICFLAILTGVGVEDLILFGVLYVVRMFGVTGGYHRYFSHRTYKTSRVMQFLLAVLAMSSAQKGVLWWASHHRHHHRHSDSSHDVHSPRHRGFWWSHMGWVMSTEWEDTDESRVKDLAKYPELVWLNKHPVLPSVLIGAIVTFFFGWSGLVVGYLWSTVACWHATFTINSLSHVIGSQRYDTGDDSRNNFFLALLTLGEGWHNNHHHYQASARNGFFWWEVDFTYYTLWVMSKLGLVWDLRQPPKRILEGTMHADIAKATQHQADRKAVAGHLREQSEDAATATV